MASPTPRRLSTTCSIVYPRCCRESYFVDEVSYDGRRGARPLRLRWGAAFETTTIARRCAAVEGSSLHANVRVAANDRDGLEHLAR
jgi:hypothetical protein